MKNNLHMEPEAIEPKMICTIHSPQLYQDIIDI